MSNQIDFEIQHAPAYAALKLKLRPDQTVLVESGALAAMDSCIQMKSKMQGGLMKSLGRMLGGESLFMSEFTAKQRSGELLVAPGVPGDVKHYPLSGNALMVQSSGFVACSPTVTLDTKFQGMKGFFSGESMFLVRASGTGDLWFSSYGAVLEIPVDGDYVVDTGYVVAFEETLSYQVEMMGGLSFKGLRTGLFGGEGLVCRFRGRGRLWIQSRQLYSLLNFLYSFRPVKNNS
ncbi:MAG: TIGR00266 family protein [Leptolyngbyaceae cyanobacterium CSU_1_3]|nr:TIGR00266 family protein [Leptolyngbyaceae cyanobacterium CSU_1_3]